MSNVSEIVNGVIAAKEALGDLVVKLILTKFSSTYVPGTSKTTNTTDPVEIEAVVYSYTSDEIDGTNILARDLKAIVFTVDEAIDQKDTITFDGIVYKICSIKEHKAGSTLVVLEVQLRK